MTTPRKNIFFPGDLLAEIEQSAREDGRRMPDQVRWLVKQALAYRKQSRSITESLEDWQARAKREGRIK